MTRQFACTLLCNVALLFGVSHSSRADESADAAGSGQHVFYLGDERLVVLRFQVLIDGKPYRTAWEEFLDQRFKELDADGDGALAGEELRGIPAQATLAQLGLVTQGATLLSPSQKGNGKVTREEFAAYFQRIGLEPFRVRVDQVNANQSRVATASMGRPSGDEAAKVLFDKLDADGDGQLTPEDFRQATHILRKLDLDRDEAISAGELVQTINFLATAVSSTANNQPPKPKFVAATPGQSNRQLAQQIVAAMDGRGGGAKDNRLTFAELGLPAETLSPFDADGDGALDFEETQQLVSNPPADAELIVRLGTRGAKAPMEFVGQSAGRVSQNVASLTLGKVQLEFSTGETGFSNARTSAGTATEESLKRNFKQMDRDNNGYLDAMESRLLGANPATFALIDTDKDGKVFENEYLAFYLPLAQMEQARVQLDVADGGRDLFRVLDTNNDGRLGPREFAAAIERMANWDTNGDGKLAFNEIPQQFRLIVGRGTLNPNGRVLAVSAFPNPAGAPTRAQPRTGPQWFLRMDRNGDGDVSQREFLGPPELFSRLDTDGNGLLDAREAAAADAATSGK